MAFCADGGAEDDEVLSNAGMNDVHGAHSAASVIEHPFGWVMIQSNLSRRVRGSEVLDDIVRHERGIVRLGGMCNRSLC